MPETTYMQVGRNCLADFIGADAHAAAEMAEMLAGLGSFASACEEDGFQGRGEKAHFTLGEYLPHVAVMIRKNGWLSKGQAWNEHRMEDATAIMAWTNMQKANSNSQKTRDEAEQVEEQDIAVATKTIALSHEFFDAADALKLSDYEHNLKVSVSSGVVEERTAGMVASAINFIAKNEEKKAERVDFANSQFVGTIGERSIFRDLKCIFDARGGGRPVVFVDAAGNKVSAWNPGFVVEKGATYTVKATPVKQDEYKGIKSTMLNRMVLATEKDLAPKAPRKPRAKKTIAVQQVCVPQKEVANG